jgi:enoyl-CoA hydratase
VEPERALAIGLVHEVVDDARAHAEALAHELAALSPVALAMIKRAVYQGADLPLSSELRIEADACVMARLAPEAAEAMEAYAATPLERRRAWLNGDAASSRR